MHTLALIRSDPNTESQIAQIRVWVLRFAQKEGKRGARAGRAYLVWWVLVAGKGSDEDLGSWSTAAAVAVAKGVFSRLAPLGPR